ncbi:hypothetical protein G8764_18595 [Pseudomaricurvus alcaniphilus]|uniref:PD-(D/E)XK nuclease family protein n=1 Tax=Pseudomaricurvus alcaniphilus TaxID=1166482 RepID=UPI0014099312|nr:PD-(D/E)XK nuclease family protein [Pseudomaricurvus alcaniphilus]NHN39318.1 hypothetical protein [Pseudomaricurvus alcaniphilus]
MPASLFSIQPLLPAIDADHLILTPNSRLRRKVIDAYSQYCLASGATVWRAPRVFALADWIEATYQELLDAAAIADPRMLASDSQQRSLWLDVINSDTGSTALINPLSLANDAASAYRALLRWQLTEADLAPFAEAEKPGLVQWLAPFQERLASLHLCLPEQAQQVIIEAFEEGLLVREANLLALGFEDLPPLTTALFAAIATRTQRVAAISRQQPATCQLVKCESSEAEVRAAANWALQQLQANSEASIAVIAPELGQSRTLIERVFTETFEPHYSLPHTARYTLPFNFSAGVPLGSVPLIHTTLQLLRLNFSNWAVADLVMLLNSTFWGPGLELDFLQQLVAQLRRDQREHTSTGQLRRYCHRLAEQQPPATLSGRDDQEGKPDYGIWLDNALQTVESLRRQHPRQAPASRWATLFERQLRCLGWPGERRLDSNEYQQMSQWYQLLEEFARFDISQAVMDCSTALDLLGQLAMNTHFQAQTPNSPIQILGILEGAGLEFSHCWVLGMAQKNWPPAAQPNPLLPLALQRHYGMPHADASRELLYAQRLTDNYRRCADEVMFSFAAQDDEAELQPSPLVADLPQAAEATALQQCPAEWQAYLQRQASNSDFQWLNLNSAPAVTAPELAGLRGGTRLLKDQAILPAAAFLLHRVGAENEWRPADGLTPVQRGQLVHDCLADIWSRLQTRQALLALEPDPLQQLLHSVIAEHIGNLQRREPAQLGARYLALEGQRLGQLLERWLELEQQRPDFRVEAIEQALDINFAGLPLQLRLDRVDKLDTGERVMIDYKTGKIAAQQWAGARPEEPQLPLYSLNYQPQVDAIMFAGINANEVQMVAVGEISVDHPGFLSPQQREKLELPDNWPDTLEHWRTALTNLVTEFLAGDCSGQIKAPALRRHYQHLAPLLRWPEQAEIQLRLGSSTEPQS